MALVVQVYANFGSGVGTITLTTDDVALLVVKIEGQNSTEGREKLRFTVTSPRSFARVLIPGENFTAQLVGIARMPVTIGQDYHGADRFVGLDWIASFGL